MAMKITNELMDKVEKTLQEYGVYADVYRGYDDFKQEVLKIFISWGDWKHEHLRAEWVIEDILDIHVRKWNTDVTEENGSDCYSAVHTLWLGEKIQYVFTEELPVLTAELKEVE